MKFAGILEAGRVDGVLTDSKWVKGTYIAVNTISERNSIPSGVRTVGTKCYVATGNSTNSAGEYRWNGSEWEYIGPGITFQDLEKDNWHIYGRRKLKPGENAQWVQIDSTYILDAIRVKLREELDAIYAQKSKLEETIANLTILTTDVRNVEDRVGKVETRVSSIEVSIDEILGEDGHGGKLKELQDSLDNITSQVNSIETSVLDLKNKDTELDKRITQATEVANTATGTANTAKQEAEKANQNASNALSTAKEAQKVAEETKQKLDNKDFDVPIASTSKIGGIKSAGGRASESSGSKIRYYIDVQSAGDKSGLAYVDVDPATVDEEVLKKSLTAEVIDERIWPDIKGKIDTTDWGTPEDTWLISGGDAESLK